MRTSVLASDRRADAERIWRAVEGQVADAALSCSWDWTGTWLEHFGGVVRHRFVIGEVDGAARGIALVTEGPARYPPLVGARMAHIGTAGEPREESVFVERNRLLVAPGDREAFAAGLLAAIATDRRWERLALDGMHAEDAAVLLRVQPRFRPDPRESPVADLASASDGDVLSILPSSRRQRLRRTLREFGSLRSEWATTEAEAHDVLGELIVLHQRRWTAAGEPGKFASGRFTGFHRALVTRLVGRGAVMLFRVRGPTGTVGCLYGFLEGDRLLFYQSGLAQYEDNKLRAGHAVHALCMQACLERGLSSYDFLAPATRYKQELSTHSDQLVWAWLDRSRLRARLDRELRRARDAWRRRAAR